MSETAKENRLSRESRGAAELLMSPAFRFLLKMPATQPLSHLPSSPVEVVSNSKDHLLLCTQPMPKNRTWGWTRAMMVQHNPCPRHADRTSRSGMPQHWHPGTSLCQTPQLSLTHRSLKIIKITIYHQQSTQELGSMQITPFSGCSPGMTPKDALGECRDIRVPVALP